jgi:signal transduction histidine kinase
MARASALSFNELLSGAIADPAARGFPRLHPLQSGPRPDFFTLVTLRHKALDRMKPMATANETSPMGEPAHPRQMLGALARDARLRSRMPRLALQTLIAAIASYWIGPWALVWLALMQATERFFEPWILRRVIAPLAERDAKRAERARLAVRVGIAALFAMSWAPAWAVGGDAAGFFAATMLCGALIHSLIYFSNSRTLFYASIASPLAAGVITPLFFHAPGSAPLLAIPIIGVALLRAHWAQHDQNALFESVDRNRARRKEAEEVSRVKTRFLELITHELRTPLNVVIGYADILKDELQADGRHTLAADAEGIGRAGWRLLALVEDVIDFTNLEAGRVQTSRQQVDVRSLVGDVVAEFQPLAAANRNRIEAHFAEDVGVIAADRRRLRQCLANLVSNACKFTSDGRISLRCAFTQDAGRMLRIDVEDTGCGISPAQAAAVFDAFTQVDSSATRAKDGLGLGLAIARRLARLHGGDVALQSTPGAGSTFTLTVSADPVATLHPVPAQAA